MIVEQLATFAPRRVMTIEDRANQSHCLSQQA